MPRQNAGATFSERIARRDDGVYVFRCQRTGHPEESFEAPAKRVVAAYRQEHDRIHHSRGVVRRSVSDAPAIHAVDTIEKPLTREEIRGIIEDEVYRALLRFTVFSPKGDSSQLVDVVPVAERYRLSKDYFIRCIKAYADEEYRLKLKIPRATLDALPLRGWFRRGNRWFIKAYDLKAQL